MAGLQTLLPPEVLAHVALYVGEKYHPVRPYLTDLLALRCACKAGKKAVERAAREHKAAEVIGVQRWRKRPGYPDVRSLFWKRLSNFRFRVRLKTYACDSGFLL